MLVRTWGTLDFGSVDGEGISQNAGFWHDDSSKLIYRSHFNGYYTGVGFWDDFALNPWTGYWTYGDQCRAGVFIDLPDKRGYLAFANLRTGRVGYDYGGYQTEGKTANYWYFYDVKDLGAAALGQKRIDSLAPSSYMRINYPLEGGLVPGACFDSASRMLYVYVMWSDPSGGAPVIHAYHVKDGSAGVRRGRRGQEVRETLGSPSRAPAIAYACGDDVFAPLGAKVESKERQESTWSRTITTGN